jgi:hypothetical protein
MGSGAVIYVPSFIQIGSGVQKLIGGYTDTHRQQRDLISLLCFFKIRKIGLKNRAWSMGTYCSDSYERNR